MDNNHKHLFSAGIAAGIALSLMAGGFGAFFLAPRLLQHHTASRLEVNLGHNRVVAAIPKRYRRLENPSPQDAATLSRARTNYTNRCSLCHGDNGKGNTDIGRNMFPRAADLTGSFVSGLKDGEIYWIVEKGLSFVGMPAFGDVISEQERWVVVGYIRELQQGPASQGAQVSGNQSTAVTTTARGPASPADVKRGKELFFAQGCNQCHGDMAQGRVGPNIAATKLPFKAVLKRIRRGSSSMPKYDASQISDQEARFIYDWLESLAK
jgi:mono/diheme cytochrome c family protein